MLSDAHFMDVAYIIASAGTCSRLEVGAVIAHTRRIVSTGYNGAPAGMPHCNHTSDTRELRAIIDNGCNIAVHAEANAIAYAARRGQATEGAMLYVTHSPCQKCAELIINAGIKGVTYDQPYRITDGLDLLRQAHILVRQVNRSDVYTMPSPSGHEPGVYSGQHSDPAFDEGWQAFADDHHRRGTGLLGGGDG